MNHGRHGSAGTSRKAEELHKLQLTRCQADRGGVGGFQLGSARGGDGLDLHFNSLWGSGICRFGSRCAGGVAVAGTASTIGAAGGLVTAGAQETATSTATSPRAGKKSGVSSNLLIVTLSVSERSLPSKFEMLRSAQHDIT